MNADSRYYVLEVNPEPWRVGPVYTGRKGGKIFGNIGRDQQLHAYEESVKETMEVKYGKLEVHEGPFMLVAWFWRNRAEYKTPQSRTHRKHEADGTNLYKALEDALQGVLYKNDKDNVAGHWHLIEQGPEAKSMVVIQFTPIQWPDSFQYLLPAEILGEINADTDYPPAR